MSRLEQYLEESGCKDCVEEKRYSDEKGLSTVFWSARDKDGERVDIVFQRKGTFYEGNSADDTTLRVLYYVGDMPAFGDPVAEFKDGRWVSWEG